MRHRFQDDRDRHIRICWAINCALEGLLNPTAEEVRERAETFLDLFERMNLEQNPCDSCGGLATDKNPVVGGLHPRCRAQESYKANDVIFSRPKVAKIKDKT